MNEKVLVLLKRFLRGGISTAVALMIAVAVPDALKGDWGSLAEWLQRLGYAGIVGLISGVLMTADKYFRYQEEAK